MKKYRFSSEEIDCIVDHGEWHDFVRTREAEIIFSLFPERRYELGLEVGAGDGTQSAVIAKACDELICTELDETSYKWKGTGILERSVPNVRYELCDAQDLSRFQNGAFDLIFSSNVLEHIPDIDQALSEFRRVLRNDGVMLHAMPSRHWKVFKFLIGLMQGVRPTVHGVSSGQVKEFLDFGYNRWVQTFRRNGFEVVQAAGLPFYFGFGPTFKPLMKLGNALYWPSSYLYVAQRANRG